jgi:uridylate kinase
MRFLVLKVGGSIISPKNQIADEQFLSKLVDTVKGLYRDGQNDDLKLLLVTGGGNLSRTYRNIALSIGNYKEVDQHRIGIVATWMNAELVRLLLEVDSLVFKRTLGIGVFANSLESGISGIESDLIDWKNSDKRILVSGGFVNGASTDLNAIVLASKLGSDIVYKLSDVDHIYTSDIDVDPDAKPIDDLTWNNYLQMFGETHEPGQHVPVDVLGAKLAKDNDISLFLTEGSDPTIINEIITGKKIEGTLIH